MTKAQYVGSKFNIVIEQKDDYVILYNCATGGIAEVEFATFNLLSRPFFSDEITNFHELLKEGYIVGNRVDEYSKLKFQASRAIIKAEKNETIYVIAPTLTCNMNCVYCFEKDVSLKSKMTMAIADKVIEFIYSQNCNKKNHSVSITWFGGEPLLQIDIIKYISERLIQRFQKLNISFSSRIITNGLLLTEKNLDMMLSLNLREIQITLDGKAEEYCRKKGVSVEVYDSVINNIINCAKKVKVKLRLNADKANFDDLCILSEELLTKCNSKNIDLYLAQLNDYSHCDTMGNFFSINEYANAKKKFNRIFNDVGLTKMIKQPTTPSFYPFFCGLLKPSSLVIGPSGEIYKCEHHLGIPEKIVGDVESGIWYNQVYIDFYKGPCDVRCINCNIYPSCRVCECAIMMQFTGSSEHCDRYNSTLKYIIDSVKNYIEYQANK